MRIVEAFKSLFKPNELSKMNEETYSLEWRNKYLSARIKYLTDTIEKQGGSVESIEDIPDVPSLRDKVLAEQVRSLEAYLAKKVG